MRIPIKFLVLLTLSTTFFCTTLLSMKKSMSSVEQQQSKKQTITLLTCKFCQKLFQPHRKNNLNAHVKYCKHNPLRGENLKKCKFCEKTMRGDYLKSHKKTCKNNPKKTQFSQQCQFCFYSTPHLNNLKRHKINCKKKTSKQSNVTLSRRQPIITFEEFMRQDIDLFSQSHKLYSSDLENPKMLEK